jgi:beta-fructofuranosidase
MVVEMICKKTKVPQYDFSGISRLEDLEGNPLFERFRKSRESFASDPYRPRYHFVSPESNLNDPNGLCYWKGRWHLFYQGYPPEDSRVHWGHAVSDDLVHWKDLPYAIYPDAETHCFSGSALAEEGRVIAMYHGVGLGNRVAVADDELLLNWRKISDGAQLPIPDAKDKSRPYQIFDPCIWKKDGLYYSLSGVFQTHKNSGRRFPIEHLFRSQDLKKWEYLHPFVEGDIFSELGDDRACPYFWPIGDRHILLHFSHIGGGRYLLGDYDKARDKFVAAVGGKFTFGNWYPGGVHAPSACPDGSGGVITIFNINPAKPTPGWNQIMSLPRRLTLLGKDELGIEPAGDTNSLRSGNRRLENLKLPANEEIVPEIKGGNCIELEAEIDTAGANVVELNVLRSPEADEFTSISFYRNRGKRDWLKYDKFEDWEKVMEASESIVTLDTSRSSVLPDFLSRAPESASVYLAPDEPLKLRVFIDKSVVEVFVNGRQCVAARVYPGNKHSTGISLTSRGREAFLKRLDIWDMSSIYEI